MQAEIDQQAEVSSTEYKSIAVLYRDTFFRPVIVVLFQICTVCLYRDTFLRKIPSTFIGAFFSEFQI